MPVIPKHHPENVRIKRTYFDYLRHARQRGEASVDAAAAALHQFETDTGFRSFKDFRREQAIAFSRNLADQTSARTGQPLSRATRHAILAQLRGFFLWLSVQRGYKSCFSPTDADYFNLSLRDARIAQTRLAKAFPSLDQVRHVIRSMPCSDSVELRNRALLAFILLTGTRDGAVVTLKLKHIDIAEKRVVQDAREVATKFGKTFGTEFFPIGDDVREIVESWIACLQRDLGWGPEDPLFPATAQELGPDGLSRPGGLERKHWTTAGSVRDIFKRAFTSAGLPYYSPHRLRDTLVAVGKQRCRTIDEMTAWGQNLGHEHVGTTLANYGKLPDDQKAAIVRGLVEREQGPNPELDQILESSRSFKRKAQRKPDES
jgi:integrase